MDRPGDSTDSVPDREPAAPLVQRPAGRQTVKVRLTVGTESEMDNAEQAQRDRESAAALAVTQAEATWADPDAFAATKAANQDDYGAGIVLFAEQWARLMEAAVARGETVASAWDRCSHLADTMGMSGFSASCAERMIRQWWIHRDQCPPPRWPLAPKAAGTVGAEGGVP